MLRRPTSSPETLLYASESPAGAGPSWLKGTSLVAQTAGHTRVAEVAQEAVARARLIPEDVRLVMAKVVADDGVVHGLSRSDAEGVRRDHNPARDGGGAGGDVAREVVGRNLHARRAEKRDADPREVPVELRRLDASGYARVKHWRVYAEEGLASCEVAVWLGDGEMALEYGGRTLSRYDVSLSLGAKLESVSNPRLFASPYETGQPKLFALSALGDGGWIKAMRLKGYAPRRDYDDQGPPTHDHASTPRDQDAPAFGEQLREFL